MSKPTYRAVLRGNRLEWRGEIPPEVGKDREIDVAVAILRDGPPARKADSGARMAAALEKLAASSTGVTAIEDPVAWQREVRGDRPLPGRD